MEPQILSTVVLGGKTVKYYLRTMPPEEESGDYISVTIDADQPEIARELQRRGYLFTERSICLEVPLKKFTPTLGAGKKFRLSTSDWQPEEVYAVASESFDSDRRFAVDMAQEDTALKNELLHQYIFGLKKEAASAVCLYQGDQLEGFTLWQFVQEKNARIRLGAVSKKYLNTGIAMSLYSQTLCAMKEAGAEVLDEYVATSNLSSLNLHAMLIRCCGGTFRFGLCRDSYRKEPNKDN